MTNKSSLANLLTSVWQRCNISIALPNNAEVRNGKFRNGGRYSGSWLDANTTQTTEARAYLRLCGPTHRGESCRALYCSTQQNRNHDPRTNHFQTPGNEVIVLSVAHLLQRSFHAA